MVLAYLEGRQRRGGRKARPGVGSQKALRLGEAALRARRVPLGAIAETLNKMGVDMCAPHACHACRRLAPCALIICMHACMLPCAACVPLSRATPPHTAPSPVVVL